MATSGTQASAFSQGISGTVVPGSPLTAPACRLLDIVVSLILLVATLPLMLVIALAIRIDSPGSPLFRQRRVGRRLAPFTVNKFRTMRTDAGHDVHRSYVIGLITREAERPGADGELFKLTADQRVTRVGRVLRKSSLDELPQLWNVLVGEMSLVGPRPSLAYEVERYPADWMLRFSVKPGITGLWQVSGRSRLTWEQMIRLDEEYVRHRSFWGNVRILLLTLPAVLFGRGAA
jgi:lipopolysaccharide/colanic/teichoic acid biosynthesis glycosyltransferase